MIADDSPIYQAGVGTLVYDLDKLTELVLGLAKYDSIRCISDSLSLPLALGCCMCVLQRLRTKSIQGVLKA
jgi:hypothetical protein